MRSRNNRQNRGDGNVHSRIGGNSNYRGSRRYPRGNQNSSNHQGGSGGGPRRRTNFNNENIDKIKVRCI